MEMLWNRVDRIWDTLASVKLTLVILTALLLLSIPGTLVLQHNISSVDPGMEYSYSFWNFAQYLELFTAYRSFWYVGFIILLSLNLIACSVNRWPQMWKMATMPPRALNWQSVQMRHAEERYLINDGEPLTQDQLSQNQLTKDQFRQWAQSNFARWGAGRPKTVRDESDELQFFWSKGRWSRVANYLVHTSLLIIFAGAIVSSIKGFEGALNIPEDQAVDTFLVFQEGNGAGLKTAPGGLDNERLMGNFRLELEDFDVSFYEDFPGRPKDFSSKINVIDRRSGEILKTHVAKVNEPLEFGNFVFYQASYGSLGVFDLRFRVLDKKGNDFDPSRDQFFLDTRLGEVAKVDSLGVEFVTLRGAQNVQGLGAGVQVQALKDGQVQGEPFWILQKYPLYDLNNRKDAPWVLVLDEMEERYFSGIQVAYDPGAPIYWFGCFGLLLGTFYALLVQHRKYHLIFKDGKIMFTGSIHRLPFKFREDLATMAQKMKASLKTYLKELN